jgi:hypothetical protein
MGLRLLAYPDDSLGSRTVVRVLGARYLIEGAALLPGRQRALWCGSAIDALHALTCLGYGSRSATGRRAAHRSAIAAACWAVAHAVAAIQARDDQQQPADAGALQRRARTGEGSPGPPPASATSAGGEPVARVASADAKAWPEPTDSGQHILVGTGSRSLVRLRGGVMDGATVSLSLEARHYDIHNADEGPQRYVATGDHNEGLEVFELKGAAEGT